MIRQFTIVPALFGITALIISACSAGGGGNGDAGGNSESQGLQVPSELLGTWILSEITRHSTKDGSELESGYNPGINGLQYLILDESGNHKFNNEPMKAVFVVDDRDSPEYLEPVSSEVLRTDGVTIRLESTSGELFKLHYIWPTEYQGQLIDFGDYLDMCKLSPVYCSDGSCTAVSANSENAECTTYSENGTEYWQDWIFRR